jgi:hypothetical protein
MTAECVSADNWKVLLRECFTTHVYLDLCLRGPSRSKWFEAFNCVNMEGLSMKVWKKSGKFLIKSEFGYQKQFLRGTNFIG